MRTRTKTLGGALVLGLLLGLQGCGSGSEDKTAVATKLVVNSPAAIAQESADDYDDNVNGVISGATLKRWIDDWPANRPAGISGKLVILQVTAGPAGFEYLKSNGTNVFTYLEGGWTQVRTNGVIETIQMVLDGSGVDALLKKYNIDPRNDMIVCAQGTASAGNVMAQGRCWYTLRYWGVDKANLALLNGSNQWNGSGGALQPAASYFQAAANTAPNSGTISVKQLSVDNTQLQATMADMLKILPSSDLNQRTDGVFIWDARDAGQFSAGEYLEGGSANAANCTSLTAGVPYCTANVSFNYMSTFQNSGARQGHPWGALQLNYVNLLDSTKGFSWKPKAALKAYLDGELDANGYGFLDASYRLVGQGNAYQPGDTIYTYCETTFRAMITGVATAVVLGLPTRFYDGAMVEWNSLSYIKDKNGNDLLPADSPWRTDTRSFYRAASSSALVAPRNVTNPYARSADAIVRADSAYKTGESVSVGGGGGAPSNPCGG